MTQNELTQPAAEAELVARNELAGEPTEALKDRLQSLLARTADDLREMAFIVGELESRGEDLSALKLGLIDHLRRIAAGQLLPEVLVRCSGFPALLQRAVSLPLGDQRKLAAGEPLEMAVWRGDSIDWRRVDPLALTRDQLHLVFSPSGLRSKQEQVSLLEDRGRTARKRPARPQRKRVRADADRGGIIVGRVFAPLEDVLGALAELKDADYETDLEDAETTPTAIHLTAAEKQQLKVRAAKSNASMGDLVRRAMVAHGLIRGKNDIDADE